MTRFSGSIKGIQAAQAANLQMMAALKPNGELGEAVRFITTRAHRFATQNTVVDTGSWRASHRMVMQGLHARIFIDPSSANPRGGRPEEYGAELERIRGGRYAVYKKTAEEAGPGILKEAGQLLIGRLP